MAGFQVTINGRFWVTAEECCSSAGIRVGHVVRKRRASGITDTWDGSVTTGARGSRCTTPDGSAVSCKAPLRGDHIARGFEDLLPGATVSHRFARPSLSRKSFLEFLYQSFRFFQLPNHLLVSLHCG